MLFQSYAEKTYIARTALIRHSPYISLFCGKYQGTNELRVITGHCTYMNAADRSLYPYPPHGVI